MTTELLNASQYGKMSSEDVRKLYIEMKKKEILESYSFPTKKSSDGFYHTYIADSSRKGGRRQLKAKTLEALKEKVYDFEKGIQGHTRKSFKDVFEIVQTEKTKYIKNPEKLLSVQNTINRNRSEYKRFFGDTKFQSLFIDEITKNDIESVVMMNLERYSIRKKALASMRAILNSVFELAYCEEWIKDNVYKRIDFKKYQDMLVESTPVEERAYTDDELQKMLDYIHLWQKKKPNYIPSYALELQIICAFRRGEIPPLTWSDIKQDHILIHKELITVKKLEDVPEHFEIVDHTKTYKNRKFPITDDIQEFLERLKWVHDRYYPKSEFLFPSDTELGCITNNHVYNFFRRICKKLNITIDKEVIRGTHAFRRTRITETINNSGGNIILASELFGNSPEVARKNYYTGIDLEEAKKALG